MNFSIDVDLEVLLAVAVGIVGVQLAFNIATALAGAAFRAPIERIQFGYPPTMRLFRIGRAEVRAGPILLGGHVKYVAPADGSPYAPWPVRAVLCLVGPLAVLGVCAIPLGARLINEALMAWPQMWAVLADWATPINLDTALRPSIEVGGVAAGAAVVAVKAAMFNLLPLPFLSGGMLITTLIEAMTGRTAYVTPPQSLMMASLFIAVGFGILLVLRIVTGA